MNRAAASWVVLCN